MFFVFFVVLVQITTFAIVNRTWLTTGPTTFTEITLDILHVKNIDSVAELVSAPI